MQQIVQNFKTFTVDPFFRKDEEIILINLSPLKVYPFPLMHAAFQTEINLTQQRITCEYCQYTPTNE